MKPIKFAICACFAVALLAAAQGSPSGPNRAINDADVVALPRQVHPLAKPQFDAGVADPSDRMERMILMLALRPGADVDLDYLIQQQHDPYSALYHQWLTPEQFGAAFGMADGDLNTIVWWLQQHGFTVDEVARGRRWINFTGSVGQVEHTFHTEIHKYLVNGELHHANATPPSIPRALADLIVGFASLHDFYKKPAHGPVTAVAPDWNASNGNHYLAPGDFATIYNVNPLYARTPAIDGTGQIVAVVARSNVNHSDPTTFRSTFKLPAKSPNYILNGNDPGLVGGPNGGEVTEADLDVQWSGAVAYNTTVDMVISKSTQTTDGVDLSAQYIVNNNLAPIMTTSFGLCEQDLGSGNTFYANLWTQAASQGITPFVSSGDSGAAGCDAGNATTGTIRAVNGLCSPPNSVCVGGTQFMDTSNPSLYWAATNSSSTNSSALSYIPEQAWNESGSVTGGTGLWSTGGGASTLYAKPTWQVAPGVPADSVRDVPDVSLSAASHDGYLIYQAGGLYAVGGTSAASPSFASVLALVIQQQSGTRQGNANKVFYPMGNNQYAGSSAPAVFHDITVANNTVPGVTGYSATTGFDLATGLGSVNVNNLVLNWGVPGFSVTSSSGSATLTLGSSVNVGINTAATNGFSASVTLSASGLPSGVTASFSPNPLPAPGSGISTLTLTAAANAAVGTVTVTVTATGEGISHTTTFSLIVNAASVPATMTSPTPGTALPGPSVTFTWTTGSGVVSYWLWIGTTVGNNNLYDASQGTNTSVTVNNLPTNGSTLYVRLFSWINNAWQYNDYSYTAAGTSVPATMTSPTPGTALPGPSVTFTWSAGSGVASYWLWIGTTVGNNNLYDASQGTNTSVTVSPLSTNGGSIYVRLYSWINNAWQFKDYTYGSLAPATMTSPTPGTALPGPSVTFTWSAGSGVASYWLWIGTAPGGANLYDAGQGTNTSVTVSPLSTNSGPIYVRLFSWINNAWKYNDYTYGSLAPATMTSPTPGSTLSGSSVTFTWTTGSGVVSYWLWIGTVPGGSSLYDAGQGTNTSVTVNNLPTNGGPIYVRLFSWINNAWQYNDYTYTATTL